MSLDLTLKNLEFNFKVANSNQIRFYDFDEFRLDAAHKILYRGGEQISLTPKAVETLLALVERQGEVVSKDELMRKIWADTIVEESNLAQYLHVLRKVLGNRQSDGKPLIETLKRRGYRFNGTAVAAETANNFSASTEAGGEPKIEALTSQTAVERGEKPIIRDVRVRSAFAFAAFAGAILLAAMSFVWFKSPAAPNAAANNELRFLALTNGEKVDGATVSPDGKYFVYVEQGVEAARLWRQEVGRANRIELCEPFRGAIDGLTFTPDSQTIYFLGVRAADETKWLYRISTSGGEPTKILDDIASPVSFAPDGSEMVFERTNGTQSALIVAAPDGAAERVLLTRQQPAVIAANPAWSPDGTKIAFGEGQIKSQTEGGYSIFGLDLASGRVAPLSSEKLDICYRMAWLPNGANLIFVGTKFKEGNSSRRDQIYSLFVQSGAIRRLTNDGRRHLTDSLSVTSAGEILAVGFDRAAQIWSLNADGDSRTALQITNGQSDGRGGIAPLADGRINFLSGAGDGYGIWQINSDGSDRRQIISNPSSVEELRPAPIGNFFVFASKVDGHNHLFRADADGANQRQLTFGESSEVDSTVSPDGNWIIYASTVFDGAQLRLALWRMASSGGAAQQLSDQSCNTPHYSPDGKLVSCIDGNLIRLVSAEDGSLINTFEASKNAVLNVGARWTPDGRNLVYIVNEQNAANLWQQPTSGAQARRLTDFTNDSIYNFAFSADGSKLYVARGMSNRNAVLIKNFQ